MKRTSASEELSSRSTGILGRLFGRASDAPAVQREASVVAIASGKGGTGKSFLASNLAVAMSDLGRDVTLVDCDFSLGNAHLLLGVSPRRTVQHVLGGQVSFADICLRTRYGPTLVPAGSGISRLADLTEDDLVLLGRGLGELAARRDCLVFDTAAGISAQCLLMLLAAPRVLLVTNPEIAALTDAYAVVKCLSRQLEPPEVLVVVNRVSRPGQGEPTFRKLAEVARRYSGFDIHYIGEVPEEPAVTTRRLGQAPLVASHPDCEAACCIKEIMERLDSAGALRPREVSRAETLPLRMRDRLGRT